MTWVYVKVFTLEQFLERWRALVVPAGAAVSEMGVDYRLGLCRRRDRWAWKHERSFVGALAVGVLKSIAISTFPELEMLTIYIIVIVVLVIKPQGLFGGGRVNANPVGSNIP